MYVGDDTNRIFVDWIVIKHKGVKVFLFRLTIERKEFDEKVREKSYTEEIRFTFKFVPWSDTLFKMCQ